MLPLPPTGRSRPLHAESVHDLLQSLLAAMALVVCPADVSAPVVNLDKVRPGGHQPEMPLLWQSRHPNLDPVFVDLDSPGVEGRARRLIRRALTGTLGAGWIERLPSVFARQR